MKRSSLDGLVESSLVWTLLLFRRPCTVHVCRKWNNLVQQIKWINYGFIHQGELETKDCSPCCADEDFSTCNYLEAEKAPTAAVEKERLL